MLTRSWRVSSHKHLSNVHGWTVAVLAIDKVWPIGLYHFRSGPTSGHKRSSSVNFGWKTFLPENICSEKLTKCPNFTWFLPEKHFPEFGGRRGATAPPLLPPSHTPMPRALQLGQEAKKVKSPWSIVLLSWKVILSVQNAGNPFDGQGFAPDPAGKLTALPQSP